MKTIKSSEMNHQDQQDDIYATYRPKALSIERIREKKHEPLTEIEDLIEKLSGKIPFNHELVKKMEELKSGLANRNTVPQVLEKVEIISYFNKYGIAPARAFRVSPKELDRESWKSLLATILGEFPVDLCNKRADILSRIRDLLTGLFSKKGMIPNSSDMETISLFNAIRHGVYEKMGISTWDDLMFMTFGRKYFKFKTDMKNNLVQDEGETRDSRSYFKVRKKEILSLVQWYQTTLSLDDALQPDISKTFDLLFRLLPKGSFLKRPNIMAEIVIFHVLKEGKCFTDWDLFVLISPLGNMPMGNRTWLLRYKQYLPQNIACFHDSETPDLYLKKLYETSRITEKFKSDCEKNKLILIKNFKCIKPRTVAGIACYLALKKIPDRSCTILEALARMGIENPGSIINAVKRLKERREYRDDLFN